MSLSTTPFSISSATYIQRIIRRWLNRWMLIFLAALATFAVLGFASDATFFIVAVISIFTIPPTSRMIVYYYYGLTPRIVMLSSFPVSLSIDTSNACVIVNITPDDRPPRQFTVPFSAIKEITPGDTLDTIVYGNSPGDILLIDKKAFPSQSIRIQFHNYIFDNIQKT
ncbi:MAG: hypothetical protein K2L55_08690 [Muribaculaceae bacterium]|nr:hypothetical protein [Muribaculaceae bacterium]